MQNDFGSSTTSACWQKEMDIRLKTACYNVYNSDYILEFILKYLDLNEQVQLLTVSNRFAYVLSTFLWPKTCTQIHLYKTPNVNIITSAESDEVDLTENILNEVKKPKVALNHKQCNDFLILNAKNVTALNVHSEYFYYHKEVGVSFKNIQMFTNLTELSYYRLILNDDQLAIMAKKCKKLKKLRLIECYTEYLTCLIPGEHINLKNIYEMKNLNELTIQSAPLEEAVMTSYQVQEILLNMRLRKLILKNFTINDNDADSMLPLTNTLEVLNIGLISMRFWQSFLHYLNHFERLRELCVSVSDCNTTFDIQLLDILATKCKQLAKLTLEKCDLNVEDFGVLKTLRHLSLTDCGGLTFANFQQILGALTLRTFALINTRIFGTINHIYVSPTLEEITIDTIRFTHISDAFQKSLNNFENLHTLKWVNGDINDNWIIDKCPKLKYLHIPNPYLLRRIVFTMKSIRELTFTSCTGLSWCFIVILIRNLTLERLCLLTNEIIDDDKEIPLNACGIKTTLKTIIIPITIFKTAQSFWIDLLHLNKDVHFSIYGRHEELLNGVFLDELIFCEKFYRRVKCLDICGFKFDCLELQDNFNQCMHQLNKYTSHYRFKKANFTLEI